VKGACDYIVYADESGSPVLDGTDADYPVFVLAFVLVAKAHYSDEVVPAIQRLKFDFTGHDQLILHERDIRRQSNNFAFLQVSSDVRNEFLDRINALVANAEMRLICAVIKKVELAAKYKDPWSPYDLALMFCMERLSDELAALGQVGRRVHVVFESRGAKEDAHLELQFRRIAAGEIAIGRKSAPVDQFEWEPVFADKRSNSAGLQLADLIARPVGLSVLRPGQPNRAFDVFAGKILKPGVKRFP